jgi:hypothetical protein
LRYSRLKGEISLMTLKKVWMWPDLTRMVEKQDDTLEIQDRMLKTGQDAGFEEKQ